MASRPGRAVARAYSLRSILAIVTLATVLMTAGIVHLSWWLTASAGVERAVAQTDRQVVARVSEEVGGLFDGAKATLRSLKTIFVQRVITADDPVRREFLFLSHLQAHPHLTWISIGFPDGAFFGARRPSDDAIQMVEVTPSADGEGELRIDHYAPTEDDIFFERRELLTTDAVATDLPWYPLAADGGLEASVTWTDIHDLPVDARPGLSASLPVHVFEEFVGVISVSVALDALDEKLRDVQAGRSGTAFVIDRSGRVVSAPDRARTSEALMLVVDDTLMGTGPLVDLDSPLQRRMRLGDDRSPHYVGIAPLPAEDWLVVTVIPESDFTDTIESSTRNLAIGLLTLVTGIGVLALAASRQLIDRPLSSLVAQLQQIESFRLGEIERVPSRIREVRALSDATTQMAGALQGVVRFVPANLVRSLVAEGTATRPRRRTATLLYLDLEGFTALGEASTPEDLVSLLNEFFTLVDDVISENGGSVMQFQGDAILAAFNLPTPNEMHALCAVNAARAIVEATRTRRFGAADTTLAVRIGINTGSVLAATVGSEKRADYTIHGDAVNLSARLEQLNKTHGSRIIASADTLEAAGGVAGAEPLGDVEVRGKQRRVTIYRLA